ncbi:MAG TPA: hypothetical protein DC049_13410 [Spirochaetia bacterium]|nr:hypothetical protein [Spirochaetia bacterium]
MQFSKRLMGFLRSARLGMVLIVLLIILSILAALIPQGMEDTFYMNNFPRLIVKSILLLHFHRFFYSGLFMIIAGLIFFNLALCTYQRFKNRRFKSYNIWPDIIHLGILVILAAGFVSILTRKESFYWLNAGEKIHLSNNEYILIEKLEFEKYPDGRAKDYITHISYFAKNAEKKTIMIRVNKPALAGKIKIYQQAWEEKQGVFLENQNGEVSQLTTGGVLGSASGEHIMLREIYFPEGITIPDEKISALFFLMRDKRKIAEITIKTGEKIAGFTMRQTVRTNQTGLNFITDPGEIFVLAGIIIILSGLCCTYASKTIKILKKQGDNS